MEELEPKVGELCQKDEFKNLKIWKLPKIIKNVFIEKKNTDQEDSWLMDTFQMD